MEANRIGLRLLLITAVAPAAWGTTYVVTENLLPADRPLLAAVLRALPAGLVLLALRRQLPRGVWWWRSFVLGACNFALFFPLLFTAAFLLPGGLAATVQAMSPLAVMAIAWPTIGERPGLRRVVAALVGILGVALLVMRAGGEVSTLGLAAAVGSVLSSALGFVLVKRWPTPPDVGLVTMVSWQLVWGGLLLVPIALAVEGPPPALTLTNAVGFIWLAGVGTTLAYVCWFHGLTRMPAGATALVGLVNPVVGTGLGILVMAEPFGWAQLAGMVLVLGGVVAGQRSTRRAPAAPHRADTATPRTATRERCAA